MKRLTMLGSLLGAVAVSMIGCGDNSAKCGEGTYEEDGVCLPDGTVTCGQGTVMDETGNCVPSDEVCAEGTVFVEGECVPEDDTLTADFEEEAEPNDGFEEDDGVAGEISLGTIGDGLSVHGCITPYRDLDGNGNDDIDYDMWLVTVPEPSVIDVTADGVHGLSAGFLWIGASDETLPVVDQGWIRYGINLSNDTSSRQVYLPTAGTYAMVMSDSRSIFLTDGAAGSNEETCYYTSISRVAIPAAVPLTLDEQVSNVVGGAPLFYSFTPEEGALIDVQHAIASAAASASVVALKNDAFYKYGEAAPKMGGLRAADEITLVVEPIYNYAQAPVDFTLRAHPLMTDALPIDGTTADGESVVNDFTWFAEDEITYMWFDVGDNEVVHFDMAFSVDDGKGASPLDLNLAIVGSDLPVNGIPPLPGDPFDPFAWSFVSINTFADFYFGQNYVDTFNEWVRFPAAGRYYMAFFAPDLDPGTVFHVTSTVTRVVPGGTTYGTPVDDAAFNDLGRAWRTIDLGAHIWSQIDASGTNWGDDVSLDFYDATEIGVVDLDFGGTIPFADLASDGSDSGFVGRIITGLPANTLVSVRDFFDEVADGTSTYDLTIADRDFSDLGTVLPATPVDLTGESSVYYGDAPGGALYFIRGTPGHRMTITVTPEEADVGIDLLDRTEDYIDYADSGFDGDPETLGATVPADGWIAIRVYDFDADGAQSDSFELEIDAVDPCAGGTILPQTPDGTLFGLVGDEAFTSAQTLPFAFPYFADTVSSTYWVSTNGFLSFGPNTNNAFFANQNMPLAAAPNGVVAPYWDDLENVQICKIETADTVTIKWLFGVLYFTTTTVDFETVLHSDGQIEFNYGPDHTPTGTSATIGAENLAGTLTVKFGFNQANMAIDRIFSTLP